MADMITSEQPTSAEERVMMHAIAGELVHVLDESDRILPLDSTGFKLREQSRRVLRLIADVERLERERDYERSRADMATQVGFAIERADRKLLREGRKR